MYKCNQAGASSKKLSNKLYVSAAVLRAGSDCMTAVKGRGSLGSGGSPAANILQIVRAGPGPSTGGTPDTVQATHVIIWLWTGSYGVNVSIFSILISRLCVMLQIL